METVTPTKTNERTSSFEKMVDEMFREINDSDFENESKAFNKEVFNQAATIHQNQTDDQAISSAFGFAFPTNYALQDSTQRLLCMDHANIKCSEIPSQSLLSLEDQQFPLINSLMWEPETPQSQVAESFMVGENILDQVPNLLQCQMSFNIPTTHAMSFQPAHLGLKHSTPRKNRSKLKSKPDIGLKTFANKVMEIVQEKKVTSFDEVTSEMLREMHDLEKKRNATFIKESEKKNIRRRVYDILNVMFAIGIVLKEKKKITWIGMNIANGEEPNQLELEVEGLRESIKKKTAELQQLMVQRISYTNLLLTKQNSGPEGNAQASKKKICLPFITVNTKRDTIINHRTSSDKLEHVFDFERPFHIHDNMEVLIRMGMAFGLEKKMCKDQNLEIAKTMVSKEMEPYLVEMAKSGPVNNE